MPVTTLAKHNIKEQDLLVDVPTTISATHLNQDILKAPAPVTIITKSMIRLSGIRSIPHLLRLAPGFIAYDVDGSRSGVTNRGLSEKFPGDMEVMIDGRSIYDPLFSAVEWSSIGITVDDIEQIEVVRSANAPAQGSNAFLGAINIITRSPAVSNGGTVNVEYGSQETRRNAMRLSGQAGTVNYLAGVTYHKDDGFDGLSNPRHPWETARDLNESLSANLKLLVTPTVRDTLNIEMGYTHSRQEYPDYFRVPVASGFVDRNFDNGYQHFRWTRDHNEKLTQQLSFTHNHLKLTQDRDWGLLSDLLTTAGVPSTQIAPLLSLNGISDQPIAFENEEACSDRYDLEYQQTLNLSADQRMVWGAGVRYDLLEGEVILGNKKRASEWTQRLYGNHEWRLSNHWLLNTGLMFENTQTVGSFFSPRIALNYLINHDQSLRLSFTDGHRKPSTLDAHQIHEFYSAEGTLLITDIGPPAPLMEASIHSVETGYMGRLFHRRLTVDLRAYYEEVRDYMSTHISGYSGIINSPVTTRSSTADWRANGAELMVRYDHNGLLASAQYAYTEVNGIKLQSTAPYQTVATENYLPRHNLSLLLGKRFKNEIEASLVFYAQSSTDWTQGDPEDSHERLDLRLAFPLIPNSLDLELVVQHPLGDYSEYYSFNKAEDRVFLKASFRF